MKKKTKFEKIDIPVDSYTSGVRSAPVSLICGKDQDFVSVDTVGDYIDIDAKQLYAWLKEHYDKQNSK